MDYLQISKLTNYLYTFTCLNDEFTLCAEDGLSDPTLYWIALSQLLCFGDHLDSLPETIHFNQYFNSTLPTALKVGPALNQYSALSSTEVSFYTKCAVSCLAKLLRQSKVLDSTSQLTLKSISRLAHNLYHYDEFAFTAKATPSIVHPFYLSTDISRFFYHLLRKEATKYLRIIFYKTFCMNYTLKCLLSSTKSIPAVMHTSTVKVIRCRGSTISFPSHHLHVSYMSPNLYLISSDTSISVRHFTHFTA